MVELEQRLVQKGEFRNAENIRPYVIDITNETVIELRGITNYKWKIYEPLLNALRATRRQTESGEVAITPMPYKEVKEYFPENPSWRDIKRHHKMLSKALAPSGWSIDRKGQWSKKPIGAPWFLRGPDDGVQNKPQPRPKQEIIYSRALGEEKKQAVLKQFDPLAYGNRLLFSSLTNVLHPEAEKNFTTDLCQFMSSCLPADLKMQDILGNKAPQEFFQEIIKKAVNNMAGKQYEDVSPIQQKIMLMWNQLRTESGKHPKTAIFEHFGIQPTSSPAPQSPKDITHS